MSETACAKFHDVSVDEEVLESSIESWNLGKQSKTLVGLLVDSSY